MLVKYVFIQDDPFYLPEVLDKYLREYYDTTAGINIQPIVMGKRSRLQTAREFLRIYGIRYFQWKLRRLLLWRMKAGIFNRMLRKRHPCYSVRAVAEKYGVPVHTTANVNSEEFRGLLRGLNVDLIVSASGTQFYGRRLREQTPQGIINCHGGLLPRYRGLMPSFWTLANGEHEGGCSVHYVDDKLDNGPIVAQSRYRLHPNDTLEEVMARGKHLAAETLLHAVRLIESGEPPLMPNPEEQASSYSIPTRADVERFLERGHRFF